MTAQDFASPATAYQALAPERKLPAIEQIWGPYLQALSDHTAGGKVTEGSPFGISGHTLGKNFAPPEPLSSDPAMSTDDLVAASADSRARGEALIKKMAPAMTSLQGL